MKTKTGRHSKYRYHRPCRPRQDHPGGRAVEAKRRFPGESGSSGTGDGFQRHRAGAGHHHPLQEHRRFLQGNQDQHRGHAGTRGFWRRSRAGAENGGRRRPGGGRFRGRHASDQIRAAQGAGTVSSGHRLHQQNGPSGGAAHRSHRRSPGALHRPGRIRRTAGLPLRLRFCQVRGCRSGSD